jgi:hypothetical protein
MRVTLLTLLFLSISLADDDHHHEHKAPHGGTLVVLGDEAFHLEFVLDAETGKLTAWVLDGEAETFVRIAQKEIALEIALPPEKEGAEPRVLKAALKAVPNVLTGETEGDTSEFSARIDDLKGEKEWDAVLQLVEVKGVKFEEVAFNYPKGNEEEPEAK